MASTTRTDYRHAEHAGNFADLFKHTLLTGLLTALRARGEPLVYLESHAGAGRYTLGHTRAQRMRELVDRASPPPPPLFATLLELLEWRAGQCVYPGSPWIASRLLGPNDRLHLVEQDADTLLSLTALFTGDTRIKSLAGDGLRRVIELMPTASRPGLLLVDPPYVRERERDAVTRLLNEAVARWPAGTIAAWYPRRGDGIAPHLHEGLCARAEEQKIDCWIDRPATSKNRMRGCGVVIINPPSGFARKWKSVGEWLAGRLFAEGAGRSGTIALG